MKTNLFKSTLALLALCPALSLQAQSARPDFGDVAIPQIAASNNVNGDTVAVGTSRVMVSLRLGAPSTVLPDGSWLYSDYLLQLRPDDAGRPATLVVRFTDSKVTRLSLADQTTVLALRQRPQPSSKDKVFAANQPR